jgi:hypothetical protein
VHRCLRQARRGRGCGCRSWTRAARAFSVMKATVIEGNNDDEHEADRHHPTANAHLGRDFIQALWPFPTNRLSPARIIRRSTSTRPFTPCLQVRSNCPVTCCPMSTMSESNCQSSARIGLNQGIEHIAEHQIRQNNVRNPCNHKPSGRPHTMQSLLTGHGTATLPS